MVTPDRAPSSIWSLHLQDFDTGVTTLPDDMIRLFTPDGDIHLSRPDARLLAKRINECLDATVKR